MNQTQYEAKQIIMQCSRHFADQMMKCMENARLLDEGFSLIVHVANSISKTDKCFLDIDLMQDPFVVGRHEWNKTRIEHSRFSGEEWNVDHDNQAKAGTVPEEYGMRKQRDVMQRMETVSEHPYPLDGFWISDRDDDPVLGGG